MEVALSCSATSLKITPKFSTKPLKTPSPVIIKFPSTTSNPKKHHNIPYIITPSFNPNSLFSLSSSFCFSPVSSASSSTRTSATSTAFAPPTLSSPSSTTDGCQRYWMVVMEPPPQEVNSKPEIIDYYVKSLERVLGSEKDAQMSIYAASCDTHFGFCCDIDEETSRELASLSGVLSVRPDPDFNSVEKDYSYSKDQLNPQSSSYHGSPLLFPAGNSKYWLVRMDKPAIGVITKAKVVDYYAQMLTRVLRNEKDAQMCIYHISWQSNFGFCCELDEECAQELAGVPGVLSVQPDENVGTENKNYGALVMRSNLPAENLEQSRNSMDAEAANQPSNIKTKMLFVTGLSFYTSEKTLRAAFEGFGELVEVKIIMDKISKRSKGYAFIEYTTEEAAGAALKEMNGKIINGWMIVVDVAKSNPPKYSRGRPRPSDMRDRER